MLKTMSPIVSLQKIHSHLPLLDVPDILNQNRACEEIYLQPKNKNKKIFKQKCTRSHSKEIEFIKKTSKRAKIETYLDSLKM